MALFTHNFNIGVPSFRKRIFTDPHIVSTNTLNLIDILIPYFQSKGWNPNIPIQFTIIVNSGIYLGSANANLPTLNFTPFHPDSRITIINNGFIYGAGGFGGVRPTSPGFLEKTSTRPGQDGGTAIETKCFHDIINNGVIAGGGGGGAGVGRNIVVGFGPLWYSAGGGGGRGYTGGNTGDSRQLDATETSAGFGFSGTASGVSYYGGNGGDLGMPGTGNSLGTGSSSGGKCVIGNSKINWQVVGTRIGDILN